MDWSSGGNRARRSPLPGAARIGRRDLPELRSHHLLIETRMLWIFLRRLRVHFDAHTAFDAILRLFYATEQLGDRPVGNRQAPTEYVTATPLGWGGFSGRRNSGTSIQCGAISRNTPTHRLDHAVQLLRAHVVLPGSSQPCGLRLPNGLGSFATPAPEDESRNGLHSIRVNVRLLMRQYSAAIVTFGSVCESMRMRLPDSKSASPLTV